MNCYQGDRCSGFYRRYWYYRYLVDNDALLEEFLFYRFQQQESTGLVNCREDIIICWSCK